MKTTAKIIIEIDLMKHRPIKFHAFGVALTHSRCYGFRDYASENSTILQANPEQKWSKKQKHLLRNLLLFFSFISYAQKRPL